MLTAKNIRNSPDPRIFLKASPSDFGNLNFDVFSAIQKNPSPLFSQGNLTSFQANIAVV
jgi:hypothetical protein